MSDQISEPHNRSTGLKLIVTTMILLDAAYFFWFKGGIPLYHDDPDARPICFVCHHPLLKPVSDADNTRKIASYGTKEGDIILYHHADCLPPILVAEFETQKYETSPQIPIPGSRKGAPYSFLHALISTTIFLAIAAVVFYRFVKNNLPRNEATDVPGEGRQMAMVLGSVVLLFANATVLTLWTQVT